MSTLDLIDLSKHAVLVIMMSFQTPLDFISSSALIGPVTVTSIFFCFCWTLVIYIHQKRLRLRLAIARKISPPRGGLVSVPRRNDSAGKVAASYVGPALLPWLGWAAAAMIIRAVLALFALLIVAPYWGYNAGKQYIHDYVVGPQDCEKPLDRVAWLANWNASSRGHIEKQAQCVRITRSGIVVEGRVVVATTAAVVLYNPKTGIATRQPLDGAQIDSLGQL